jgi:hypothetical protein
MDECLSSWPDKQTLNGGAVLLYNPFEDQRHFDRLAQLITSIATLQQAGLDFALYITWDGEAFRVADAEPEGEAVESWFVKCAPGADPVMMRLIPGEQLEAIRALIEDGILIPAESNPGPKFN